MDNSIFGANLLVVVHYFPAAIMLISAIAICMNMQLKEVLSLPRGQYVSLLIAWAFLVLEIFHAVAVILSLDVWCLSLLHALQEVIRGDCLPGEGLICHLFLETARHLATLVSASILVTVLTLEEDFTRSVVPEIRQALEALEDWWDSKRSPTCTPNVSLSVTDPRSPTRKNMPPAQKASRITPSSRVLTTSKEQPRPSSGKLKPNTSTCMGPRPLSPKGTLIKIPSLVASTPSKEQPGSLEIKLNVSSSTSMVSRHHKGAIRRSSLMDSTLKKEQPPPTGLKIKPATKNSTTPKRKARKVSVSTKPPTVIKPSLSNEQPGYSGGKVKLTPGNAVAKRQSAIKGARTTKLSGQDNDALARQKKEYVKKK